MINPRAYGIQFEMYAGTSGFAFLQNQRDGGQPVVIMSPLDKSTEFFGDCDIPNHYNKTEINSMMAGSTNLSNYYNKAEINTIVSNIDFRNYDTKTEIDDIDNALPTITLNT